MKKQQPPKQAGAAFDSFAARHKSKSYDEIYMDVLDSLMFLATAGKECKDKFEAATALYGKDELMDFVQYIADESADFQDILGRMYEHIQSASKASHLGQYFTPEPLSALMALLVGVADKSEPMTVGDPCGCGSGRNILAMARHLGAERWRHQFLGTDIDLVCVKISIINCWLQSMPSLIIHGDALAVTYWAAYEVVLNWDATEKRWYSFIVKQPAEVVDNLMMLQKQSYLVGAHKKANTQRVEKLQSHKAEREATISPIVEILEALECAVNTPTSDDKPEADKSIVAPETNAYTPAPSRRKGKQPPPNQVGLF